MSTGKARTEIACTLSWFSQWSPTQREQFLCTVDERSRNKYVVTDLTIDSLMSQLSEVSLNNDKEGPSVFECQLKIFSKWYENWDVSARTEFVNSLIHRFPDFETSLKGSQSLLSLLKDRVN